MATNFAPTTAQTSPAALVAGDYEREATARAAAKAGMTVDAWIAHTDQLEAQETRRRRIDQSMRQVPRYRGEAAA